MRKKIKTGLDYIIWFGKANIKSFRKYINKCKKQLKKEAKQIDRTYQAKHLGKHIDFEAIPYGPYCIGHDFKDCPYYCLERDKCILLDKKLNYPGVKDCPFKRGED